MLSVHPWVLLADSNHGIISFYLSKRGREGGREKDRNLLTQLQALAIASRLMDLESSRASVTTCMCTVPAGLVLWSRLPYKNRVVDRGRCKGSGK